MGATLVRLNMVIILLSRPLLRFWGNKLLTNRSTASSNSCHAKEGYKAQAPREETNNALGNRRHPSRCEPPRDARGLRHFEINQRSARLELG